jgi:hypothetical protein
MLSLFLRERIFPLRLQVLQKLYCAVGSALIEFVHEEIAVFLFPRFQGGIYPLFVRSVDLLG